MRIACRLPGALLLAAALVPAAALAAPAPDAAQVATLARAIGRHAIRVQVGGERYEIDRAVIDTAGVSFDPATQSTRGRWRGGEKVPPPPLASPLAWAQVEQLDVPRSGFARGAAIGGLVAPITVAVWPHESDPEGWWSLLAIAAIVPGALAGGIVGAFHPTWKRAWPQGYIEP